MPDESAWLELPSGATVPIDGTCAIGRAASNQLLLHDDHVSRHHAVIRTSTNDGCWIFDLGSANGTHVNRRRINSQRLGNGDTISIGPYVLVFHSAATTDRSTAADLLETVPEVRCVPAWLFVVDIEESTDISRRLGALEMERVYGEWLARCKAIVQDAGGIVDKLLGDGFLAFWPAGEQAVGEVARAVLAFKRFRFSTALPFRMVLHHGTAFTGGEIASGMYRLFGIDVNFAFRMETLAKTLGETCLLSAQARQALGRHLESKPAGTYALPGIDGSHAMFRL